MPKHEDGQPRIIWRLRKGGQGPVRGGVGDNCRLKRLAGPVNCLGVPRNRENVGCFKVSNHGKRVNLRGMKPNWEEMCQVAEEEITRLLVELPEPLRARAKLVPVALERRPGSALQADGIESNTLGLFTGPEWAAAGEVPQPPHIILFLENVWESAEMDGKPFSDEIGTTFLHELGHFFGFDEGGLGEMGLE